MNKIGIFLLLMSLLFVVVVGKLYVTSSGFEDPMYPKYREEYAHNLKNPLLERYRKLAIESPLERFED